MKKIPFVFMLIALSGCNQYTLVKTELVEIEGIAVTPQTVWNSAPSQLRLGGRPTWTADGTLLNSVTFISAIKDGQTLFKAKEKEQFPTFASDMLPNEIVELVESSIVKLMSATVSGHGSLKPLLVDGHPGFETDISIVTRDDVPRKIYVAGTVKDEALYLILFQATEVYYYDKYIGDVTNMAEGMALN